MICPAAGGIQGAAPLVRKETGERLNRFRLRASSVRACRATPVAGLRCASGSIAEPGLHIIDTGYTSPANINYLTGLGHSVFLADLVHDACTENWRTGEDEEGDPVWNVEGYLNHALKFSGRTFDVVLLWTALDYLPEPSWPQWWRTCARP